MRADDRIRVQHMIDAADAIAGFVAGRGRQELDRDQMLLFAVVRAVSIIGEAAVKVSAESRAAAPGIPWREIVDMRNRLVHGYFDIDPEIVWLTATQEVPTLATQLRDVLSMPPEA